MKEFHHACSICSLVGIPITLEKVFSISYSNDQSRKKAAAL